MILQMIGEIDGAGLAAERRPLPVAPESMASVAVLPLENLSGDPRADHLCDGITDDITGKLTRFRDLHIVARHSAYKFKGHKLPPEDVEIALGQARSFERNFLAFLQPSWWRLR